MEFQRSHRVGEQIQKEISALILKGLKDPRVGFVTITAVEVSRDLHYARIFFTVIGDERARGESERGLNSALPYLRREIGKRLRLRLVPELTFEYDTSLEYGNRIESLLRDLNSGEKNAQGDPEDDQ
ncbi:ribosome-binding factor A [Desulfuromonas carbonis]|uniref:30S ribosome-binding factor RbfA n=1 Tax=Desulfuromonas sp. DDH964 TaxID=1823759 RepID=UPI00078B8E23|nr:30S ribosome-binding factor RbfA [Desulfuromonas sp. DDH964]AMV72082.1 ribosome-binding factor A [Desulfuromonas sp. DDH964]